MTELDHQHFLSEQAEFFVALDTRRVSCTGCAHRQQVNAGVEAGEQDKEQSRDSALIIGRQALDSLGSTTTTLSIPSTAQTTAVPLTS